MQRRLVEADAEHGHQCNSAVAAAERLTVSSRHTCTPLNEDKPSCESFRCDTASTASAAVARGGSAPARSRDRPRVRPPVSARSSLPDFAACRKRNAGDRAAECGSESPISPVGGDSTGSTLTPRPPGLPGAGLSHPPSAAASAMPAGWHASPQGRSLGCVGARLQCRAGQRRGPDSGHRARAAERPVYVAARVQM